jgi:hypothetical protein
VLKLFSTTIGHHKYLRRATSTTVERLMRLARFENSIKNKKIKVATNTSWRQTKAFAQGDSGRRAVLQDRASDGFAGTQVVDFHNTIVS